MIYASPKFMDLPFVHRMFREHGLDVSPIGHFEWSETSRWYRRVERYRWGAVMFLSERNLDQHFTLVLVGKVDVDAGTVTVDGQTRRIIVPDWYQHLATHFVTPSNHTENIDVPPCLGTHAYEPVCDGGVNGFGDTEPQCSWREYCIAVQEHAAAKDVAPSVLFAGMKPHDIVTFTGRLLEERQRPKKRKAFVSRSSPKAVSNPAVYDIFAGVYRTLSEMLSPRPFRTSQTTARPGEVFFVDQFSTSNYLTIYVRPDTGYSIPLVKLRRKTEGVDFQLPLPPDHHLLEPVRSHVVSWRDGRFLSAIKRVPIRVSIEQACTIVKLMVEEGAIELPAVTTSAE